MSIAYFLIFVPLVKDYYLRGTFNFEVRLLNPIKEPLTRELRSSKHFLELVLIFCRRIREIFCKRSPNPSQNFYIFATMLQKVEVFEGVREPFFKKFPYNLLLMVFYCPRIPLRR